MQPTHPTRRHFHHRALRVALAGAAPSLLPALSACASGGGLGGYQVSEQRLAEALAKRFPLTRSFGGGVADLTLQSPRLALLPAANRIATAFDVVLTERITGRRVTGALDMDSGVRLDLAEGTVRLVEPRVNRLDVDQLGGSARSLVQQYAPPLAEQLLANFVIYRLSPEQAALARNLGLSAAALRVVPGALQLDFAPAR